MSKRHFKIVPFLVAFAMVCSCVFAAPVSVSAAGMVEIDIYDYLTGKDYIGSDVIVHYDLPLDAHTELYGMPYNGSAYEFIASGQWVSFTQTLDHEISVSSLVASIPAKLLSYNSSYGMYYGAASTLVDLYSVSSVLHNGKVYTCTPFTLSIDGATYVCVGNPYLLNLLYSNNGLPFFVWYPASSGSTIRALSKVALTESMKLYKSETYIQDFDFSKITATSWPLGMENDNWRIIDISDIRSGANFDLTFSMLAKTYLNGHAEYSDMSFKIYYIDKNFDHVKTDTGYIDTGELMESEIDHFYFDYTVSFTVPEGAEYFYLSFHTNEFDVSDCSELTFYLDHLTMSCALSAIEDNSNTLKQVQKKLDELDQGIQDTNDKLDDIISGGDAGDQLGNAGDQLDQGNQNLDNVLGNLDNASGLLPDMPDNIQDVLGDNMSTLDNNTLAALMPWNDEEYSEFWNAMFTPTLAAVSVALLLYFVFGKARSG